MNYSNTYILYPYNRDLERAIAHAIGLLGEAALDAATLDTEVTVADNFLHTRGNYEQHRYSTNILDDARAALEAVVSDDERARDPRAWAENQNSLGNILAALAQQQHDAALYVKAIECFSDALDTCTREEAPLEWAATQTNLGTALQALGRLESDAKLLHKASDAYTAALLEYSKKDTPEEWKLVMLQLGATFHTYGTLLKGNRTFQKSVVAYKNAIAELDADNYPFELAAAHNNCGAVLHNLAESEENAERFEEATRSYEKGVKVCMEQQQPIHLAVLCRVNKATANSVLAGLTKNTALADEIADEFEVIIECFSHALQPLCLKHCEAVMGKMREMAKMSAA